MMTFVVVFSLLVLAGVFFARNRIATLSGVNADTVIRICLITLFCLIFITGIRSCSSASAGAGSISNGILILIIGGLVTAAVISRERPYLTWPLTGFTGLLILALLGKFDGLFSWTVVGLPVFAAAGIWGMTKVDATANGRTKSFLGFASGIVILYWMFLFFKEHPVGDTGFIEKIFFSTDELKGIFVIFLAIFLFAVWRRSKIAFVISFIVFLSFVGDAMFNNITARFPSKLTPTVSAETQGVWEKVWDSILKRVDDMAKPTPPPDPLKKIYTITMTANRSGTGYSQYNHLDDGEYVVSDVSPGLRVSWKPPSGQRTEETMRKGRIIKIVNGSGDIGALSNQAGSITFTEK